MLVAGGNVSAMPNFARKLGVGCSMCHTTLPRLNQFGYQFRAAGFRIPDTIGKAEEAKFDLGDYFAGRIQARYDASHTKTGTASSTTNQLKFHELTLYPITGSWGKYASSLVELSIAPEDFGEVENAYLRLNFGQENAYFQARVGIFHPFEGFGGSDRPISINRPLFQMTPANFNQSTFFTPWGFDQAGAEVGYDYGRFSVRATLFNGLFLKEEEGAFKAFAAQGGELTKPAGFPAHNTPDVQLFANYILHQEGGGLSAYYYHGNLGLPVDESGFFRHNFDRVAVYASYPVARQLHLLGGFLHGRDDLAKGKGTFNSRGAFAEADFPFHEYATAGFRYDWFDPATGKDRNEVWAITPFINIPLQNGLQFISEYRHRETRRGQNPGRKDNAFQIRLIFIL
jgi:hypothetical protein